MKLWFRFFFFVLIIGGGFAAWKYRDFLYSTYLKSSGKLDEVVVEEPDPLRYEELLEEVASRRVALQQKYARAKTAQEISGVIQESRDYLEEVMPEMMRCWLGTGWDFNGTCQKPGSGKIACGYFVSTILRDTGFKVERIKMAQQPSQNIIRTMLPRKKMHIRAGVSYEDFLKQVIARGPGIRIVGLDRHVAFLVVTDENEIRFIHSSGAAPKRVVDEDRENADVLRRSNYRVTGNLTAHDDLIHRWLMGQFYPTHT